MSVSRSRRLRYLQEVRIADSRSSQVSAIMAGASCQTGYRKPPDQSGSGTGKSGKADLRCSCERGIAGAGRGGGFPICSALWLSAGLHRDGAESAVGIALAVLRRVRIPAVRYAVILATERRLRATRKRARALAIARIITIRRRIWIWPDGPGADDLVIQVKRWSAM